MAAAPIIFKELYDGVPWYTVISRGVKYSAYRVSDGRWCVLTRRLALGRWNTGGCKYYANVAEVSANCKALAGLEGLLAPGAVVA